MEEKRYACRIFDGQTSSTAAASWKTEIGMRS